jgi:trehalose 6-phosphate synthase/phosphatase
MKVKSDHHHSCWNCELTYNLDMFRALKKFDLPRDHVYSVTVGASSKQTDASWHLLEPADVIGSIQMLFSSANQDH